jgi:hypothetical protein
LKKQNDFVKRKPIGCRGQVFSTDALVGLVVFLFALGIAFYYFSMVSERNSAFEESAELKNSAFNALSVLVETKGLPENWQSLNVPEIKAFGIASERNIIDSGKLSRLAEISVSDYENAKKILGLQKFDFRVSVNDLNGSGIVSAGSAGKALHSSFKASRLALWNNEVVSVSLEAFK